MGTHKHKCAGCGFVWEHSDTLWGNLAAHTCVCGRVQWMKYFGHEVAEYVGNCRPVRVVVAVVVTVRDAAVNTARAVCRRLKPATA